MRFCHKTIDILAITNKYEMGILSQFHFHFLLIISKFVISFLNSLSLKRELGDNTCHMLMMENNFEQH